MLGEEHFFLEIGEQGQYLYCSYYEPVECSLSKAILVVPPIGHERLRCYRESVNLARSLASKGFHVFRFDYRGEGESYGCFEKYDVNTRLQDINRAIEELIKKTNVNELCLLGFRLGAIFSLMVTESWGIHNIILCESVTNVKAHTRGLFRANIIMQREYFGKITDNEKDLRMRLMNGEAISIYGFHFSNDLINQLEEIDEEELLNNFKGDSLFINFVRNGSSANSSCDHWNNILCKGGKSKIENLVNDFSWGTKKIWLPRFEGMERLIEGWLMQR